MAKSETVAAGGAGGAGGAGDAAAAGGGSGVAPGAAGSAAPAVAGVADVDALRSRIAELEAAQAKGDADRAAAEKAAADKVEADRVAALSAEQKLQEAVLRQQGELDATRAELVAERRATALERLGVLPHFRDYAPKVDPKTSDGAAALEKWAKTHPEALAARNGAAPVQAIKPIGALAEVLAGTRNSPLLRGTWAEAVLNSFKG